MPKRGFLGCSLPALIGIIVVVLLLGVVSFAGGALGKSLLGDINKTKEKPEGKVTKPNHSSTLGVFFKFIVFFNILNNLHSLS